MLADARRQPSGSYVLRAAPAVIEALAGAQKVAFGEAAAQVGNVTLEAQPGWQRDKWEIAPVKP